MASNNLHHLVILKNTVEELPSAIAIETGGLQSLMSLADQLILTPLLLIVTVVLTVMVVMRWSYAFDSVPWIASIGVNSETVPWAGAQKEVMRTFGLIKHSRIPESVYFSDCELDSQVSSDWNGEKENA